MTTETEATEALEVIGTEALPETQVETQEPAAEPTEAELADKAKADAEAKAKAHQDGVQKRINELTRKAREAERERDHYKSLATQTAQSDVEPTPEQFNTYEEYVAKLAERAAEKAVVRRHTELSEGNAAAARQAAWEASSVKVRAEMPDYDAVIDAAPMVQQHVIDALLDLETGPALAYHLAQHPDVIERLNAMPARRAAIEMGRLEATLTAPVVKPSTNAPDPVSPLAGRRSVVSDLSRVPMDDYIAMRRKQGAGF